MPSLKSLKTRITAIRSTQKITKAMKVVATSKLKKARERSEAVVNYTEILQKLVNASCVGVSDDALDIQLIRGNESKEILFLVLTASRGLCGAFNLSVVKLVRQAIAQVLSDGKKLKILCVGDKGYELLKKQYGEYIIAHTHGMGNKNVQYFDACTVAEQILSLFYTHQIGSCYIFYNKFQSIISQIPSKQQLIPFPKEKLQEGVEKMTYEFEPTKAEILNKLLPKNLKAQIYKAFLESLAGEYAARMTAMDNATRNSGEMIKKLQLVYNRTRQAYITRELIEIISGAEAI